MAQAKVGYVDGYVLPIPKKNMTDYKKMAKLGAKVWMEHGALQYLESEGDDLKKQPYCLGFKDITQAKPSETVVFAFILFKNKAHRDKVNKKVMEDPRMSPEAFEGQKMPFDCQKMAFGGFKPLVSMSL